MNHRLISRLSATLSMSVVLALSAVLAPAVSSPASAVSGAARQAVPRVICVALSHKDDALATKMAHDVDARLAGRASTIGLEETDTETGITCTYHAAWHFYAASAIKATILAALLRKAQEQNRQLTASEKRLAWLMITQSDNNAATALWNDVGFSRMQHFLDVAKMNETVLNQAWGLSLLTAHDEALVLTLLSGPNTILNVDSRVYAQYLMSHVVASQRWGVPAGAPRKVQVCVKNGWLPYPVSNDWEINSIGFFKITTPARVYLIAMLTYSNPTMAYGISTIENAAVVIHRDLNPGQHSVIPESTPNPTWGIPDEQIPAGDS